jgi:hypothetical protein
MDAPWFELQAKPELVVEVVPDAEAQPAPQQTAAQAAEQERLEQHQAAVDSLIDDAIDDVLAQQAAAVQIQAAVRGHAVRQQAAEPEATSIEDYRFSSSNAELDKVLHLALQGANKNPDQARLRDYAERVADTLNRRQEFLLFNMARSQGYKGSLVKANYFVHVVTQALPEDKQAQLAKARPATEAKIAAQKDQHLRKYFGLPAVPVEPVVEVQPTVEAVAKPQPTVVEQVQPVTFRDVIMANYNAEKAAQRRTIFAGLFNYNNKAADENWSIDEIINHAAQGGHRTARAIEKSFDDRADKSYVREQLALIKKHRKTRPAIADQARRAIKNAFVQQQRLAEQQQADVAVVRCR